jgi:hypothetical protein
MCGGWEAVLPRKVDLTRKTRVRMTRCTLALTLQRYADTNKQAFKIWRGCAALEAGVSVLKLRTHHARVKSYHRATTVLPQHTICADKRRSSEPQTLARVPLGYDRVVKMWQGGHIETIMMWKPHYAEGSAAMFDRGDERGII